MNEESKFEITLCKANTGECLKYEWLCILLTMKLVRNDMDVNEQERQSNIYSDIN